MWSTTALASATLSALPAASRVSFAGHRLAQRREAPADGDLYAACALHEVRKDAAAQRFARDRRNDVFGPRAGRRRRRGAARRSLGDRR